MTKQKSETSATHAVPDKTRQNQPLVQLTETDLEEIAAGGCGDGNCMPWECGENHNETVVKVANPPQKQQTSSSAQSDQVRSLQTLTIAQLDGVAGGPVNIVRTGGGSHGGGVQPV